MNNYIEQSTIFATVNDAQWAKGQCNTLFNDNSPTVHWGRGNQMT